MRGDRNADALTQRVDAPSELAAFLRRFPPGQRVELKDVAAQIKAKGAGHELAREELLVLMLDSYRAETRDLV